MYFDMLHKVYEEFSARLGRICIAGGAVRDALINTVPKDYDVYVFDAPCDQNIKNAVADLPIAGNETEHSGPFPVAKIEWSGLKIDIMRVRDAATVEDLLGKFDWNICAFAYDSRGVIGNKTSCIPMENAELVFFSSSLPLLAAQRGIRFARRYKMRIKSASIDNLVNAIRTQLQTFVAKE